MLAVPTFVGPPGFFFLKVPGVGEKDLHKVSGGIGAPNRTLVAFDFKPGEEAGVVNMSMGQKDAVNLGGGDGEGGPILEAVGLSALEESAIDQKAFIPHLEEVSRTGYRARRTEESQS